MKSSTYQRVDKNEQRYLFVLFMLCLSLQCIWHHRMDEAHQLQNMPLAPPDATTIRIIGLDDQIALAKLIMLWLQAFDVHAKPGVSLHQTDYENLISWLDIILELDKTAQYPLYAVTRFYAQVNDLNKKKLMLEYIKNKFIEHPEYRWQAMIEVIYIARYQLNDLALALQYAELIEQYSNSLKQIPFWAKYVKLFILEQDNALSEAIAWLNQQLVKHDLTRQERLFLRTRLTQLERLVPDNY